MWIRQIHRWLSIVFTLTVIANFIGLGLDHQPPWLVYSPLPPLFLMLVSGLYLFAAPYVSKRQPQPVNAFPARQPVQQA